MEDNQISEIRYQEASGWTGWRGVRMGGYRGAVGWGNVPVPRFPEEGPARETQAQLFSQVSVISGQEEYR